MKSGKKWLLWGLSMFLFLLLVPLTVHAVRAETVTYEYHGERYRDQEVYVEGDYKYVVLGNEAFLYRYTGTAPTIATPTSFGGKPVTVIMWEAFANNSAIQTVTVNAGVREIYERAFKNCSGLQAVLISASVETIGEEAFRSCAGLKSVTFQKGSVLKTIGKYCFANDTSLLRFSIPEKVESIGNACFFDDISLESITIPDLIQELPTEYRYARNDNAGASEDYVGCFECCQSLAEVKFGSGLKKIGYDCFAGCALPALTIPNSVETIDNGAFSNNKMMREVRIGNSVATIGASAFSHCDALETLTFGDAVKSIGDHCFRYDVSLKTINWNRRIESAGAFAFSGCTALEKVTLPASLTNASGAMFYCCTALKSVDTGNGAAALGTEYAYARNANWGSSEDYMGFFEGCENLVEIRIGNGVKTIGQDCFSGTAVKNVVIPDNVVTLDGGAFYNAKSMETLTIGNGVTGIGEYCFTNDSAMKQVTIGKGVTTIGRGAFQRCTALTSCYIPSNVTTLGGAMFYMDAALSKVVIGTGATSMPSDYRYARNPNYGFSEDYLGFFEGCGALESVTLGSGLISIGEDCFAGTKVKSLVIPSKVSSVGKGGLGFDSSLEKIYFVGNYPLTVGERAYEKDAENLTVYYVNGKTGFDSYGGKKETYQPIRITFDNNDDDVFAAPTEGQILSSEGGYVIEPVAPVALGYLFGGWYKDAACTAKWDFAADFVNADTTLYAKWTPTDKALPVRPENLKAGDATAESISLSWDPVDGALTYNVYVNGEKKADGVTTTAYTLTGLTAETTYEITVSAVNSKGEGARSLVFVAKTNDVIPTPAYLLGDVDKDGKITASDARLALRAAVGLEDYAAGSAEFLAADVDRDEKLTASDARSILRAAVGLEELK